MTMTYDFMSFFGICS